MFALMSPRPPVDRSDADRWEAVLARDASADGAFVFAVRTTGVYCRPSCASRHPHRHNASFFASGAEAEAAGFRACKRCRPNAVSERDVHAAAVAAACRLIEASEEPVSLDELAETAGFSKFHFHRIFKAMTGVTPKAYAKARRSVRVKQELARGASVTAAIYDAGYGSSSRFYEGSGAMLGMTPGAWRDGGRDSVIRFAVADCSLGAVLVAATSRGVCAIELGDDPGALVRGLQDRFAKAELIGADRDFETVVARVVALVETPGPTAGLPLDLRGTAFQQRVWQALQAIPAGTTVSYSELAHRIGQPSAVRAVARACASNPVAIAVPCHRVVRTDGHLGGYRWGIARKEALLAREAV